ncbi:conserved hypothetical protein [Nitrosomonas mobilis]|uniref:Zinc finger/thioredoxin putative domain-containing protein n=1 Tax=Nitrosomonas mobilis TaxID=51642 RepID=A0A1G5SFS5_9PROT|nr:conserved hypothetical protein [Nitrosomonas mobilis]
MTFITRCTNCHSVFRLTVAQLRTQDGKVRCGQCRCIFNALSTLSIAADAQITSITPLIAIEKDKQPTTVAAGTVDNAGEGFNFLDSPATYRPSSHSFRIANCILLALLLWQIMHGYRSEVAIVSPAWRTLLENYCVVVQCDIALPRQLSLLSLESSELKFSSTDTTDEISLTATIRNHAPFPQELPALLLSLTDVNDRVVASQILHPQDYLAPEALDTVTTGFSAHHEILIQRRFRLEAIKAMGYRLELRY